MELLPLLEFATRALVIVTPVMGALALACGALFVLAPRKTIELQIRFYRRINWILEPVSWEKEIRNTRLMGALALVCGAAGLGAYLIIVRPFNVL